MNGSDPKHEIHWLIKFAQELRDSTPSSLSSATSCVDADLAHPALSVLGEFIDRCGVDIEPEFVRGYAFGLSQAGLIDDAVVAAVGAHIDLNFDKDAISSSEIKLN